MPQNNKIISDYSISELREICQKTAPNPARESYTGRFSRIFSIYTTKIFLHTNISPNWITVLSVMVFFSGIAFFFVGKYDFNILATLLILFSIVLDGSDGEVARFLESKSKIGGSYTEPVSHDVQYGFSFLLLGIAFYLNTGYELYLLLGGLSAVLKLEFRMLKFRFARLGASAGKSTASNEAEGLPKKKGALSEAAAWLNRNFFSSTGFLLVMFFFSIVGKAEWSLFFYAIGFAALYLALFLKQIYEIRKKNQKFDF